MKYLVFVLVPVIAACGKPPEPEPAEPLTQPYAEKIEQIEQAQIQRVEEQLEAIDRQTQEHQTEDDR